MNALTPLSDDIFFIEVALNRPLRRTFIYTNALNSLKNEYHLGARVLVPFAGRDMVAVIIAIHDECDYPLKKIKPVAQILDHESLLGTELITLGKWMSHYYQQPIGEVFNTLLPTPLRKNTPATAPKQSYWCFNPNTPADTKLRGHKQIALFEHMKKHTQCSDSDLRFLGFSSQQLKALEKKSLIHREERHNWSDHWQYHNRQVVAGLTLNSEQKVALDAVALNTFKSYLLFGVTGSGKTEVYLQLIDKVLAQDKKVLMLVPEIGLTPQSIERIQQRFDCPVAISHSGLSHKERLNQWLMVRAGVCPIIIGTRSAVFMPINDLGLIIVDEEHDNSFKQQDGIRYHGRDVAIKRAADNKIPIMLGTATPCFESYQHALNDKYKLLTLNNRAGEALLPNIETVDIRRAEMKSGMSETARRRIQEHLDAGFQVLVFINRRGFAPTLFCQSCGWIAGCPSCDAKLTLHQKTQHLKCHHCGFKATLPPICPSCKQPHLVTIGSGTERVEDTLLEWFPNIPVMRIDRDTTKKVSELNAAIEQIKQGDPCILVGTQMLAKGHHLPKITLAIILDGDGGFFTTDFRGEEKTLQLLQQVAGRAGREAHRGEVLIQTRYPHHPLFEAVKHQDYADYAKNLLSIRQQQNLPPFSQLAMIRIDHRFANKAAEKLFELRQYLESMNIENKTLLGPVPAALSKRANMYRHWLWLQSNESKITRGLTHAACLWLEKNATGMSWGVDIDPQDVI